MFTPSGAIGEFGVFQLGLMFKCDWYKRVDSSFTDKVADQFSLSSAMKYRLPIGIIYLAVPAYGVPSWLKTRVL